MNARIHANLQTVQLPQVNTYNTDQYQYIPVRRNIVKNRQILIKTYNTFHYTQMHTNTGNTDHYIPLTITYLT